MIFHASEEKALEQLQLQIKNTEKELRDGLQETMGLNHEPLKEQADIRIGWDGGLVVRGWGLILRRLYRYVW